MIKHLNIIYQSIDNFGLDEETYLVCDMEHELIKFQIIMEKSALKFNLDINSVIISTRVWLSLTNKL